MNQRVLSGCLGAIAFAALGTIAVAAPRAVLSDVQVSERGPDQYVLQTRSTAAQAFDVRPGSSAARLQVQLHAVNLGRGLRSSRAPFGRVRLLGRASGDVVLRLRLRRGWKAEVRQGSSPNTVDVRIAR